MRVLLDWDFPEDRKDSQPENLEGQFLVDLELVDSIPLKFHRIELIDLDHRPTSV